MRRRRDLAAVIAGCCLAVAGTGPQAAVPAAAAPGSSTAAAGACVTCARMGKPATTTHTAIPIAILIVEWTPIGRSILSRAANRYIVCSDCGMQRHKILCVAAVMTAHP